MVSDSLIEYAPHNRGDTRFLTGKRSPSRSSRPARSLLRYRTDDTGDAAPRAIAAKPGCQPPVANEVLSDQNSRTKDEIRPLCRSPDRIESRAPGTRSA